MNAEAIRAALRCENPRCVCQRPRGQVHCPAHADEHPSLSVDQAEDGRLLAYCFAGCAQEDLIEALRQRGLWHGRPLAPRLSRTVRTRDGTVTLEGPLVEVGRFIERYVRMPADHATTAVALWIAHAWVLGAFDVTPYLIVRSPEKRSGKTRLLEVLELLAPRPWRVVAPSEAVLFRKIAKDQPTLLLDEADALFKSRDERTEPLRAVLNAGFRRGATVPRVVGDGSKMRVEEFDVFCAKAIAAIGSLPDTVEDRGLIVRLDRATPAEQRRIKRLRFREAAAEAAPIRKALARWAEAALPALRGARPAIPEQLDGRAADAWEPLLAVAEQAGDGWAVVAWEAALALSTGAAREDDSLRVRLLADIRRVFEDKQTDRLPTANLIDALAEDEAAPWGDWHGRRITPQALAQLLRPYGIAPTQWRDGDRAGIRGYSLKAFRDTWERYLPALPSLSAAPEPLQSLHHRQDAGFGDFGEPLQPPRVADGENGENPDRTRVVADVAVSTPTEGGEVVWEVPGAPPPVSPDGPCATCGRTRFWQSVYGSLICAVCRLPADPVLVAWHWVRRPDGHWLRVQPAHQTRKWRCASPPEAVRRAVVTFDERRQEAQGADA